MGATALRQQITDTLEGATALRQRTHRALTDGVAGSAAPPYLSIGAPPVGGLLVSTLRGTAMSNVTLRVDGASHTVDAEPSTPLLYVLRNDLGLRGPRFGCGLGQCGACTVLVDGVAVRSCVTPASAIAGEITTLEGLSGDGRLDPVQQAWIDEQVPQCGYCQNGQILTAKALLDRNPDPTDQEIREGMEPAICRCMTYYRVQAAVKRAARMLAEDREGSGGESRGLGPAEATGSEPGGTTSSEPAEATGPEPAGANGARADAEASVVRAIGAEEER